MSLQIALPHDAEILKIFPSCVSRMPEAPTSVLTVPNDEHHVAVLQRYGYDARPPVITNYAFPAPVHQPAFHVQKETVGMLTLNTRCYVLSGMGVAKTRCPIWAFDYLRGLGLIKGKMLVVAPLSTLITVWAREVFDICPWLKTKVLYGPKEKRLKLLAEDADIYIINHDGIGVIFDALKKRTDISMLVLDELAVYRNKSDRTKLMKAYAEKIPWVVGMTGAPTPNAPTDVYHQASIVTPWTVPKFYGRYRESLMYKSGPFKWIAKPDATEKAFLALQPSVRYTLEDVTELPEYISRRIDVVMGPRQQKVYEEIRKHAISLVGGKTITAVNAGAALNKLLQISLGYVYHSQKGVVQLDNDNRLRAVLDIIEASESKLLIFAPYKHALKGLHDAIVAAGWSSVMVSGDTPMGKRAEIFTSFQKEDKYKVITSHPQCLAHGVTLTAADTALWFGPITSLEIYDQTNARIRRVGQKKKQQFLHLQATPVEKKLYTMLINKQDTQSALLSMFEE